MTKIRFLIDESNIDKDGFAPIKVRIYIDYKDLTKIVGKVKPRFWNKNKQRIYPSKPHEKDNNHKEINKFLDKYENDIKQYFFDLETNHIKITPEIIKEYFKGQKISTNPVKINFWDAYEEYLKIGKLEKAANTNRNRLTIKNKLKQFETETGYKMTFESINLVFYDQLKEWALNTKEHGYNYLSAIIDKFKAFMSWSLERDYHRNTIYKKFSAPEKEGSIIHLTYQELEQLINFAFENKKMQKARDFYCFGCLTGLRYCDLQQLTKEHLIDGMIKTTTQKTNKDVIIPVFDELKTIIDRYPEQYKLLPRFSNQRLNDYIKECCELAGINTPTEWKTFEKNTTKTEFKPKFELIGTHTARKTFICLAYDRGMDIEMIKAITGITREKTLRRYLHINSDAKKEKLNAVFGGLGNTYNEVKTAIREMKEGKVKPINELFK